MHIWFMKVEYYNEGLCVGGGRWLPYSQTYFSFNLQINCTPCSYTWHTGRLVYQEYCLRIHRQLVAPRSKTNSSEFFSLRRVCFMLLAMKFGDLTTPPSLLPQNNLKLTDKTSCKRKRIKFRNMIIRMKIYWLFLSISSAFTRTPSKSTPQFRHTTAIYGVHTK